GALRAEGVQAARGRADVHDAVRDRRRGGESADGGLPARLAYSAVGAALDPEGVKLVPLDVDEPFVDGRGRERERRELVSFPQGMGVTRAEASKGVDECPAVPVPADVDPVAVDGGCSHLRARLSEIRRVREAKA